jgi:hypothetical protein
MTCGEASTRDAWRRGRLWLASVRTREEGSRRVVSTFDRDDERFFFRILGRFFVVDRSYTLPRHRVTLTEKTTELPTPSEPERLEEPRD